MPALPVPYSLYCTAMCWPQVSGEAQYTDDVALPPNALHAAFVTSSKPHAKLLGVDASAALAMPGGCS
jgi:xanthine dehydrogenase molybdopterin-binding subunit B